MRLNTRTTAWLALALAALVAGTAVADDRDFLRQLGRATKSDLHPRYLEVDGRQSGGTGRQ